jgi:hypothetical protein
VSKGVVGCDGNVLGGDDDDEEDKIVVGDRCDNCEEDDDDEEEEEDDEDVDMTLMFQPVSTSSVPWISILSIKPRNT